jgi:hypothetical protein
MHTYKFICSNPEGIDFILDMCHEKFFSEEEFKKLCKAILIEYYYQKMQLGAPTDTPYISRTPDEEEIWKLFEEQGFSFENLPTASFGIDVFWHDDDPELTKCFHDVDAFNKKMDG